MKKMVLSLLLTGSFMQPVVAKADLFGFKNQQKQAEMTEEEKMQQMQEEIIQQFSPVVLQVLMFTPKHSFDFVESLSSQNPQAVWKSLSVLAKEYVAAVDEMSKKQGKVFSQEQKKQILDVMEQFIKTLSSYDDSKMVVTEYGKAIEMLRSQILQNAHVSLDHASFAAWLPKYIAAEGKLETMQEQDQIFAACVEGLVQTMALFAGSCVALVVTVNPNMFQAN